jgi:hypothetical protein
MQRCLETRRRPKSSYRRFTYARRQDCYQFDAVEMGSPLVGPAVGGLVLIVTDTHKHTHYAAAIDDQRPAVGLIARRRSCNR